MLFLREQGQSFLDHPVREQISGLLTEDSNLHGRVIHGYRVPGGIDWLFRNADRGTFDVPPVVRKRDAYTAFYDRFMEYFGPFDHVCLMKGADHKVAPLVTPDFARFEEGNLL